jgi:hypothetical protein
MVALPKETQKKEQFIKEYFLNHHCWELFRLPSNEGKFRVVNIVTHWSWDKRPYMLFHVEFLQTAAPDMWNYSNPNNQVEKQIKYLIQTYFNYHREILITIRYCGG